MCKKHTEANNKKGETLPSQEYYKFPFGQHYTVIKPWGRLISVEGYRTVTLTAAHCGKDEMNAASQRPNHEAGNLSSLYVSEVDVRRQNVSKIFESIHSFIHLAFSKHLFRSAVCWAPGQPLEVWGETEHILSSQKLIPNCCWFPPTNHSKVQKPRIYSIEDTTVCKLGLHYTRGQWKY